VAFVSHSASKMVAGRQLGGIPAVARGIWAVARRYLGGSWAVARFQWNLVYTIFSSVGQEKKLRRSMARARTRQRRASTALQ
jgi:hypothetical protein